MARRKRGHYIKDVKLRMMLEKLAREKPWPPKQIWTALREVPEFQGKVPSLRTIQTMVTELRPPDDSGGWSLSDDSEEPTFLLAVLGVVVQHSEGRISQLTRGQAEWIERIKRAVPDIPQVTAYWFTRAYMLCEGKSQDSAHLDMALALGSTAEEAADTSSEADVKARIALHVKLHLELWPRRQLMVWPRTDWISEEYKKVASSAVTTLAWEDRLSPAVLQIWF